MRISTVSPECSLKTSLRENSTSPGLIATPLRLRMRCSSRWMWIGCDQPWAPAVVRPPSVPMIHRSAVLTCGVKRNLVQSMHWPLICQPPLPRSKRKVRVMRGVTLLMSGRLIGSNTQSVAEAGTCGNDTGSGSKLASATAPPTSRNSINWSPCPASSMLPALAITQKGNALAQVVGVGQEELVEPRGTEVQHPEPVAALLHLEERLDLAVHQELGPEDAVGVEGVEGQQARLGVEVAVGQPEGDVELG